MKTKSATYSSQAEGAGHPTQGLVGKQQAGLAAEGARGEHGQELWLWFLQEEMGKAGQTSRANLGLDSLKDFSDSGL